MDPYLYATPANGVDLIASGVGNELLVSLPRFLAAFTGEVLVLNASATPPLSDDFGYEYEQILEEMKLMKTWSR